MSQDSVGVGKDTQGTDNRGKGLSIANKDLHQQKGVSHRRVLSIGGLDRTHGFKHEHYSRGDVAAAMGAVEGQSHE